MVKEVNKEHKNVEMTRKKKRSGIVYFDYSLLAILICLVCFGLVMLYSTSSYSAMMKQNGDSLFYFKRQLLFCIVGFIGMWLVSKIDYHWYINKSKLFYFFSIFMMFLVKTPLGKEVNGAKRWIKLPFGQQLQPAEIAKIAVILFIPALICTMGKEIKPWRGVIRVLAWGGFSAAVVSDNRQFEYSDYRDGNNLYHDICSTSEDEDICRHSRCGNCSCDCRCKNSGNNDGNERKLPSAPYSCMAESGKICVGRWISDHAGIVCDRIWWIFW